MFIAAEPKVRIEDFWAKTPLDEDYRNGELELSVDIVNDYSMDERVKIRTELFNQNCTRVYNKYDKYVKLNKSNKTAILDDIDKTLVGTWVTHSKSGFIVLISEYDFEENSILEKEDYICAEA